VSRLLSNSVYSIIVLFFFLSESSTLLVNEISERHERIEVAIGWSTLQFSIKKKLKDSPTPNKQWPNLSKPIAAENSYPFSYRKNFNVSNMYFTGFLDWKV
jgi:hypothetical protein